MNPGDGHRATSAPIPIPGVASSPHHAVRVSGDKILDASDDEGWVMLEMGAEHLERIIKIQQKCYEPEYRDVPEAYVHRTRLFPPGNAVLLVPRPREHSPRSPASSKKRKKKCDLGSDHKVAGYILAQPFLRGQTNDVSDVTKFAEWIQQRSGLPRTEQDCLYIHEIAIDPSFRGQGLAGPLVKYTEDLAQTYGFRRMSLVALAPALSFWQKFGYKLKQELNYGGHTCYYMEKRL